eukprot:TRINITY_DN48804_c0_g1_i1.p1 TRINITY_DN48804_c0_g1~~TRINITY_DN48804_c0_g1_i1.p1  ORF type:complete len:417 (-),score=90.82 TRINITY_DN48804_c0_g1_i1:36-1223(-)
MASPPQLVLHFDVNETIMIGDPVAGIDFTASLNNVISKVAILRGDAGGEGAYAWHDGSPLDPAARQSAGPDSAAPPPLLTDFRLPAGCRRFFETFRRDPKWPSARFTEAGMPGELYRPVFSECWDKLQWRHAPQEELAVEGRHRFLPAFFHALRELLKAGRNVTVVIRTFGTDLPDVAAALRAFAEGRHPDFPAMSDNDELSRFFVSDGNALWGLRRLDRRELQGPIALRRYTENLSAEGFGADLGAVDGLTFEEDVEEAAIATLFRSKRALGIRDDYHFWRGQGYKPQAGKPLWVTVGDSSVHHIFFDDNIHNKVDDSIVAIRARRTPDGEFRSVSGDVTRQLEGVLLVKAQPTEAIRDRDYFLRKIRDCEARFARMTADGSLSALLLSGMDSD